MENVEVEILSTLTQENGRLLIKEDPLITVVVGKLNVNFENLFGGKTPEFAKVIHQFVNNDSKAFTKDFGPQITQQVFFFICKTIKIFKFFKIHKYRKFDQLSSFLLFLCYEICFSIF